MPPVQLGTARAALKAGTIKSWRSLDRTPLEDEFVVLPFFDRQIDPPVDARLKGALQGPFGSCPDAPLSLAFAADRTH
jgi:hypothetical protein